MTPCKECIVDMICTKECPMFEIDLERLQSDEEIYLNRCMNNIEDRTYKLLKNIEVDICDRYIVWLKNGERHRDNDRPAVIYSNGTKYWYRNDKLHRDNDQPAIIDSNGKSEWYKNGKFQYERGGRSSAIFCR